MSEVKHGIKGLDVVLGEYIIFLGESSLYRLRRRGYGRAGIGTNNFDQRRSQHVIHGEEDDVQRLLAVLFLDQVIDMRNPDFRRKAGIDSATACARAVEFGTGVIRIDDVFRLHAKTFEVSI